MYVRGSGVRDIAYVKQIHKSTIETVVTRMSLTCRKIIHHFMKDLVAVILEFDELFSRIKRRDRKYRIWTVFDPITKIWPCFVVCSEKMIEEAAYKILSEVKKLFRIIFCMATDGLVCYRTQIKKLFRNIMYGYLKKVYLGRRLIKVKRYTASRFLLRDIDAVFKMFGVGKQMNTAGIERLNRTIRSGVSKLIRKTEKYAKKIKGLVGQLFIKQVMYNFVDIHSEIETTPALAAQITNHRWTTEEVLLYR
jgi:IS1 family transposase